MLLLRRRRKLCCVLLLSITAWLVFYAFSWSDVHERKRVAVPMHQFLLIDEGCLRNLLLFSSFCPAPLEVAALDEQKSAVEGTQRTDLSIKRPETDQSDLVDVSSLFDLNYRLQSVESTVEADGERSAADYLLFVALNQTDDQARAMKQITSLLPESSN
ncbi:hypothetical protein M3Y99_00114700 [Aphelenchoides fujianensis]|nr:hypothetical protein M3Y99_00114700 [Aphelenchoides fujianensis]